MGAFGSRNSNIEPDLDGALGTNPDGGVAPLIQLWASVMHKGLKDYATAANAGYPATHPWVVWFHSDDSFPGSFVWLCDLFDWCPVQARKRAEQNRGSILNDIEKFKKDSK